MTRVWSRRGFVRMAAGGLVGVGVAGTAAALVGLERKGSGRIAGGFADDGAAIGHRVRDGGPWPSPTRRVRVPVVVVGGGVGGLSAGWWMMRQGFDEFVVLELAPRAGGNARWGENRVSRYPWGAHYLPVPDAGAVHVRALCRDIGLLCPDGSWDDRHLCFAPQERLFVRGEWQSGLEPAAVMDRSARDELARFDDEVAALRTTGAFAIPLERGRVDPALDRQSFAAWLDERGIRGAAVRWYLEYGCRDDYGGSLATVSAWAGLHYFAARPAESLGPLTWSEGNGWLVERMLERLGRRVETGAPVHRIARAGRRLEVWAGSTCYECEAVIVAVPLAVASRILDPAPTLPDTVVSPWLTANLTLAEPPQSSRREAKPAWDNVLYDSRSLGYVDATHQSLATAQGPAVWTWYHALGDEPPAAARRRLAFTAWHEWRDFILADLRRAHPDIDRCVTRIDLWRHPHAMVRPVPGYLSSTARARLDSAHGDRVFFAHADVSGLSLFEEAQYRGVVAAERALRVVAAGA